MASIDGRLARTGGADEGEVVGVGEVDGGRVAEARRSRPRSRRTGRMVTPSGQVSSIMQLVEQPCTRGSSTPAGRTVVGEQLGRASGRRAGRRAVAVVGMTRELRIDPDLQRVRAARRAARSRIPAYAACRTADPEVVLAVRGRIREQLGRRCRCTVRSRRPAVIGRSVILAGVSGATSTRQTTLVLSCSPKSTASGAPA